MQELQLLLNIQNQVQTNRSWRYCSVVSRSALLPRTRPLGVSVEVVDASVTVAVVAVGASGRRCRCRCFCHYWSRSRYHWEPLWPLGAEVVTTRSLCDHWCRCCYYRSFCDYWCCSRYYRSLCDHWCRSRYYWFPRPLVQKPLLLEPLWPLVQMLLLPELCDYWCWSCYYRCPWPLVWSRYHRSFLWLLVLKLLLPVPLVATVVVGALSL